MGRRSLGSDAWLSGVGQVLGYLSGVGVGALVWGRCWGTGVGVLVWGRCSGTGVGQVLGYWCGAGVGVFVWGRCWGICVKLNTNLTDGLRAMAWVGVGQMGRDGAGAGKLGYEYWVKPLLHHQLVGCLCRCT